MQKQVPFSIQEEFIEFENNTSLFQNKHKCVGEILHHLVTSHGKCLRPTMLLLSAAMNGK